jgi:hypothetical protein
METTQLQEITLEEAAGKYRIKVERVKIDLVQQPIAFLNTLIERQVQAIDRTIIPVRDIDITDFQPID